MICVLDVCLLLAKMWPVPDSCSSRWSRTLFKCVCNSCVAANGAQESTFQTFRNEARPLVENSFVPLVFHETVFLKRVLNLTTCKIMSLNCMYAKVGSQWFWGRPSVDRYNWLHCTVGEMSASARMFVVKKKKKARNPFPPVGPRNGETNRRWRANSGSEIIRSTRACPATWTSCETESLWRICARFQA